MASPSVECVGWSVRLVAAAARAAAADGSARLGLAGRVALRVDVAVHPGDDVDDRVAELAAEVGLAVEVDHARLGAAGGQGALPGLGVLDVDVDALDGARGAVGLDAGVDIDGGDLGGLVAELVGAAGLGGGRAGQG